MVDDNDWDLFAVVRGCRGCGEKPAEATTTDVAAAVEMGFDVRRNEFDELEVVFKPAPLKPQSQQHSTVRTDANMPKSTNRSRRRRSQQKKVVCEVPADGVTSDMWSWRKYGQKPIKGSPYPRGYYKCSSSKGCLARKQTERSRTDPGMFIVTYTADHNHPAPTYRNSLAGSVRHKPAVVAETAVTTSAEMSPTTTLTASVSTDEEELEDEDEAMLLVEDMEVIGEDDFLIVGDARADSLAAAEADLFGFDGIGFDDRLFSQSWLSTNNSSNAAAAGGGGS